MKKPQMAEALGARKNILLVLANIWCWFWLVFLSILALILAPLWLAASHLCGFSWPRSIREGIWVYGWLYIALVRPFIQVDSIPKPVNSPAILVINHQSWLDIYLISAQPARNLCLLVRTWPFKSLFFFGPFMRLAGYIETEGAQLDDIMFNCRQAIKDGSCIVCFPEGTRSHDGSLGRFHSGVFKLAIELNVPIMPIVMCGSGKVAPKGSLFFRPGRITVKIEPPIEPSLFANENIPHGALRRHVRGRFQKLLAKNEMFNLSNKN